MKLLVAMSLLCLSLWSQPSLATVPSADGSDLYYLSSLNKYKAWIDACEMTVYYCVGLDMPKVQFEFMRPGLNGYYAGGDTIYVSRRLYGMKQRQTLLHEMVHYLQVKRGGLAVPGLAEPICKAEAEAFAVSDKWAKSIWRKDLVVGPNWWRPYTHCYQFYTKQRASGRGFF